MIRCDSGADGIVRMKEERDYVSMRMNEIFKALEFISVDFRAFFILLASFLSDFTYRRLEICRKRSI